MNPAFVILAAVVVLGGCDAAEMERQSTVPAGTDTAVKLALLVPGKGGDTARKNGHLARDGRCLYLVGADGSRTIPAFMTPDTRWSGDSELIVGARRFRVGQAVRLGGSEINEKIADLAWVQRPDPSCYAPTYWITASIDPA